MLIALATGMRRGEVLALRWRNVDLDRGASAWSRVWNRRKLGFGSKRRRPRSARAVTLPAFAVKELRRLKREQAEDLLTLGVRQTGDTLVCARARWRADAAAKSDARVHPACSPRLKDFPLVRFHDLRHSHATQLLLAGVHPKIAQERLGHSTISITLDLYSHVTATMQEDAATGSTRVPWR